MARLTWSDGPFGPCLGIAAHLRTAKLSKCIVIGRMNGDELALEMGREFGDG
jgi:hypothetical protein